MMSNSLKSLLRSPSEKGEKLSLTGSDRTHNLGLYLLILLNLSVLKIIL